MFPGLSIRIWIFFKITNKETELKQGYTEVMFMLKAIPEVVNQSLHYIFTVKFYSTEGFKPD